MFFSNDVFAQFVLFSTIESLLVIVNCSGATIRTHQEIQCLLYEGFFKFWEKLAIFVTPADQQSTYLTALVSHCGLV